MDHESDKFFIKKEEKKSDNWKMYRIQNWVKIVEIWKNQKILRHVFCSGWIKVPPW